MDVMKKYNHKKKFNKKDYKNLINQYETHVTMKHIDFVANYKRSDNNILLLRHDVDHDIETALKMARWEYKNVLKATYCILHTAWYYGHLENDTMIHHPNLIGWIKEIQDLGHEINFHNNLVSTALVNDIDPFTILEKELSFFKENGIDIYGTSTHGDKLCHKLNFRNWEMFRECCDEKFGGPRIVSHLGEDNTTRRVDLGSCSMFSFGLSYEAYDILKHEYYTDSGGHFRVLNNVHGRREFLEHDFGSKQIVGILAHPIWWDFN